MTTEAVQKVTPRHLARTAYLYVRQPTIRQVVENTESTQRQYALREPAVALGWPPEQIIVIDTDLGQSGASAADRAGFRRLGLRRSREVDHLRSAGVTQGRNGLRRVDQERDREENAVTDRYSRDLDHTWAAGREEPPSVPTIVRHGPPLELL